MLPTTVYFLILSATCLFAFVRGGREERIVAATAIAASLLTILLLSPLERRYGHLEWGVMAVDLGVLLVFVALALRSRRFWPLWIAGVQLTTNLAHAIKAINAALLPTVYLVAAQFWVYPILVILFVATLRHPSRKAPPLSNRGSGA